MVPRPSLLVMFSGEQTAIANEIVRPLRSWADVALWNSQSVLFSRVAMEALVATAEKVDFAFYVITKDEVFIPGAKSIDIGKGTGKEFGLGLLHGLLGPERVALAVPQGVHINPDLLAINSLQYGEGLPEGLSVAISDYLQVASLSHRVDTVLSCFVAHSTADRQFANKLAADLNSVGVRVWLGSDQTPPSAQWKSDIEQALAAADATILVLSQSAVQNQWVQLEAEIVLGLEQRDSRIRLLPIALHRIFLQPPRDPLSRVLSNRQIWDFADWRKPSDYKKAFGRLVRALNLTKSAQSAGR